MENRRDRKRESERDITFEERATKKSYRNRKENGEHSKKVNQNKKPRGTDEREINRESEREMVFEERDTKKSSKGENKVVIKDERDTEKSYLRKDREPEREMVFEERDTKKSYRSRTEDSEHEHTIKKNRSKKRRGTDEREKVRDGRDRKRESERDITFEERATKKSYRSRTEDSEHEHTIKKNRSKKRRGTDEREKVRDGRDRKRESERDITFEERATKKSYRNRKENGEHSKKVNQNKKPRGTDEREINRESEREMVFEERDTKKSSKGENKVVIKDERDTEKSYLRKDREPEREMVFEERDTKKSYRSRTEDSEHEHTIKKNRSKKRRGTDEREKVRDGRDRKRESERDITFEERATKKSYRSRTEDSEHEHTIKKNRSKKRRGTDEREKVRDGRDRKRESERDITFEERATKKSYRSRTEDSEHEHTIKKNRSKKRRGTDEREKVRDGRDRKRESERDITFEERATKKSYRSRTEDSEHEHTIKKNRSKKRRGTDEREKVRDGRDRESKREKSRSPRRHGDERDRERWRRSRSRYRGGENERDRNSNREKMSDGGDREKCGRSQDCRGGELGRDRGVLAGASNPSMRHRRKLKEKIEVVEPAYPGSNQRTVYVSKIPSEAKAWDVYEFFSKAGKIRDVFLDDRVSERSARVWKIEFYEVKCVPLAISMSGQLFWGNPVIVKPLEAEGNLVQSNGSGGGTVTEPDVGRKLYVSNLHCDMTELQLKELFALFGSVEFVKLSTDETEDCKSSGIVQFKQLEHAKAALSYDGCLEIAGLLIKVSSFTEHVVVQGSAVKATDLDEEDGVGLMMNTRSKALLTQRLDRSGTATRIAGPVGVPAVNSASLSQQPLPLSMNVQSAIMASTAVEPVGEPSECIVLKNMFDPSTETDPDYHLHIRADVQEECSKHGRVKHIHVDKNSSGYVYLRFESVEGASDVQQAMHHLWYAGRQISAVFLQPYEYDAMFKGTA